MATTCTFTVAVRGPAYPDGSGGTQSFSSDGSLTVDVGEVIPEPVGGPEILSTGQSAETAIGGASVTLFVLAHETNSDATLSSYSWSSLHGALSVPVMAGDLSWSQIVWAAPTPMGSAELINVTVTDSQGVTTAYSFVVNPAP